MDADGAPSAALSSDSEFLRRIPTAAEAGAFLSSDNRKWSLFYRDLFQVASCYYNFISPQGRNRFNAFIREMLRNDRSYADFTRDLHIFENGREALAVYQAMELP